MAYIPTIHTFEDDEKDIQPIGEVSPQNSHSTTNTPSRGKSNILVPEKKEGSKTKKILIIIAIIFILASLGVLGYYFYNNYLNKKNLNNLNNQAQLENDQALTEANKNTLLDLSKIFPKLAPGIAPYVAKAEQKDGVVTLTLKTDDTSFSNFYAYILAHTRDLNSDLFYAFQVQDIMNSLEGEEGISTTTDSSTSASSTITSSSSLILNPTVISPDNINWEDKTLNNQEFEAASAGVLNLIYGYYGHQYAIFTTSLKKYFSTIDNLD